MQTATSKLTDTPTDKLLTELSKMRPGSLLCIEKESATAATQTYCNEHHTTCFPSSHKMHQLGLISVRETTTQLIVMKPANVELANNVMTHASRFIYEQQPVINRYRQLAARNYMI